MAKITVDDSIGNLVSDKSEGISSIGWNLHGKVSLIEKLDDESIFFEYDALGNRVHKKYIPGTMALNDPSLLKETYYIRDATGNILSTYDVKKETYVYLSEQVMYGSSRLGIYQPNEQIVLNLPPWVGTIDWKNIHPKIFPDSLDPGQ